MCVVFVVSLLVVVVFYRKLSRVIDIINMIRCVVITKIRSVIIMRVMSGTRIRRVLATTRDRIQCIKMS